MVCELEMLKRMDDENVLHGKERLVDYTQLGTMDSAVLVATKRKTGGLNYSKAITFGMPAGRGRKGERQPRSRRGKQTTSMVVPRNPLPSAPSGRENECENRPDGAQLHELFPASCQPSVATHQAQPSPLYPAVYNPPGVPFHGGRFYHPYASTFQAHTPQACFQAAPPHRSLCSVTRDGKRLNTCMTKL